MNTPKSSDDVMREMNEWAKAHGCYLEEDPWTIPRRGGSILDVPETPESRERVARLLARIAESSHHLYR